MVNTKFQIHVQNEVLEALKNGPATRNDLTTALGINYFSIRLAVIDLVNQGTVKKLPGFERSVKYALGEDEGPNDSIPYIRTSSGRHKLQELLELRHNKEPAAVKSVLNLPRHITRILTCAIKLANDDTSGKVTLDIIRFEMEKDLQALKNSVDVYQQILDNDRVWVPDLAKRFANDHSLDEQEVRNVHREYFPA